MSVGFLGGFWVGFFCLFFVCFFVVFFWVGGGGGGGAKGLFSLDTILFPIQFLFCDIVLFKHFLF